MTANRTLKALFVVALGGSLSFTIACNRGGDGGEASGEAGGEAAGEASGEAAGDEATEEAAGPTFEPLSFNGAVTPSRQASELGIGCYGNIAAEPSFTFTLDSAMRTEINVTDGAGSDLVMGVTGPAGFHECDDDGGEGLLPRVVADLQPGEYHVFVGNLGDGDITYAATVGEGPEPFRIADCDSDDAITLGGTVTEQTITGSMTATRDFVSTGMEGFGSGHYGATPGPCVNVTAETRVSFEITTADWDTVMFLQGENAMSSTYDDDGGEGLLSRISTTLSPGSYALHIGSLTSGRGGAWTLTVSDPLAGTTAGTLDVANCVELTPGSGGYVLSGSITGANDCESQLGFWCPGYIEASRSGCVNVTAPGSLELEVVSGDFDTTLALTGNNVQDGNDDGGEGVLSRIVRAGVAPGMYDFYVGSFATGAGGDVQVLVRLNQ